MWEVLLSHGEDVARLSKEDVAAILVGGHELHLAALEVAQLFFVVGLHPAGLVETDRLPAALGVVFVLQTVLDDLELQLSDGSYDLASIELIGEDLCHAFVHELVDALGELLGLHGVGILDVHEQFGRERWDAGEVKVFAAGEGIADLERAAVVGQTYDVAWPAFIDNFLLLCHEAGRRRKAHLLSKAYVLVIDAAFELA